MISFRKMIPERIRRAVDYRGYRYCHTLYEKIRYFYYTTFEKNAGYDREYYEANFRSNAGVYDLLAKSISDVFHPRVLVDVGCGNGGISAAFIRQGCKEVFAFDGSLDAVKIARGRGLTQVQQLDFIKAQEIPAHGDLCICCEVAEHIPEKHAAHLCRLLSKPAPTLVFTAAPPGQGGHLHVNLKPRSWWVELMRQNEMIYNEQAVERVRAAYGGKMIRDYDINLMIFFRQAVGTMKFQSSNLKSRD
jgi:SAM-dependent methyltransferase